MLGDRHITRIAKQTTFAGKTILNGKQKNSIDPDPGNQGGAGGNTGKAQDITLQVGSNKGDTIGFKLQNMQFSIIGSRAVQDFKQKFVDQGKVMNITNSVIVFQFSKADPSDVINIMDAMIGQVDSARADLGALQNRLESSIRNQSNVAANEADARSRIRDADFAEESANLSQQSIIQQAAASMLMQANTRPQLGLSLLG